MREILLVYSSRVFTEVIDLGTMSRFTLMRGGKRSSRFKRSLEVFF